MRLNSSWKIISFIFLISFEICASDLVIKGKVYERGTLKPLGNVNIYILPEGLKSTTDKEGNFTFNKVPSGERDWIVTVTGYKRLKRKYTFAQNSKNVLLYVEKKSYVEFETTVIGKIDKKDASKQTLTQSDFLKMPGSQGDPIKAVENLPGVQQSFGANVAIQGSPPEDTRYLIEGHEIPFMFHFYGLNTVAVPETVESVDFLTAGYGPEFGRASSGVINLNLKKPRTDRLHAMSFLDFTAAGGYVEGELKTFNDTSFFIGGRYSYVGEILKFGAEKAADEEDDEDDPPPSFNTAPTYFDVNLSVHSKLNDKVKFKLIGLVSQDKAEAISNSAENPTFSGRIFGMTRFYRLIPKFMYRIDEMSKFETSIGYGRDFQIFEPGTQTLELQSDRLSWRAEYSKKYYDWYEMSLGTDFIYDQFENTARITSSFFNEDDVEIPEALAELLISSDSGDDFRQGYYLRNQFKFFDSRFVFSPNFRIDHFELHEKSYFQPRVNFIYKLNDTSKIYFNSGLYYQPETPFNMSQGTGNNKLLPSKSTHYSLRYEKDFRNGSSEGITLMSGLFYKDLKDLIKQSSALVQRDGELVAERVNNSGKGTSRGFESLLRFKFGQTYFNLGYTYTKSVRIEPNGREYPSEQDQTHNLNFTGSYSWGNYTFASRFRYVTGLPYTPIIGSVYYENVDVYIPVEGEKLSERVDDFWQLDIRFDRKWIYDTWILSLYIDIQNVTNNKNPFGMLYSFDYSQSEPSSGLPILPTFGIKGEF